MNVMVTPMRRMGLALSPQERLSAKATEGNVVVNSELCTELGRLAIVARLVTRVSKEPQPLPVLLDATLSRMAASAFVLSGIELIDGRAYAQSWWCRI